MTTRLLLLHMIWWPMLVAVTAAETPTVVPGSPDLGFYGSPALQGLMDAMTFHLSFDAESFVPDMAAGEAHQPTVMKAHDGDKAPEPAFVPGIRGQALVLGTGAAAFPSSGNIPLRTRGAIALWVKPLEWRRPNGSNTVFLMSRHATFYLQRQGPMRNEEGKILRHEKVQYLAKSSSTDKLFTNLSGGVWENGRWYFVVANWAWPQMQLSIDGKPFSVTSIRAQPEEGMFSGFLVGARGGDMGLLDEVMAFDRPLSLEEVRALRDAVPGTAAE